MAGFLLTPLQQPHTEKALETNPNPNLYYSDISISWWNWLPESKDWISLEYSSNLGSYEPTKREELKKTTVCFVSEAPTGSGCLGNKYHPTNKYDKKGLLLLCC